VQNAGGSSNISEALSMQYMHNRFGANKFILECEVDYWIEYKMCDYIMRVNNTRIGVSVTRAITYPFTTSFTFEHAKILLDKKIYGLIVAQHSVNNRHSFSHSILHIWCYTLSSALYIKQAYQMMIDKDIDNTFDNMHIICTVCPDTYIYTNHLHDKHKK
jgi:hypothetical protein